MKVMNQQPLIKWATTFGLALLSFSCFAEEKKVEVKISDLGSGIYMIAGQGGNIGLMVGKDGTFMIDDQYAPMTPEINKAIKSLGGDSPRFLINTHFHGDHTGGNENFGKANALIMAHDNVRARLKEGYNIKVFKMEVGPGKKESLPVVTYNNELGLHINGEDIRAYHVENAHTDGDTIIFFPKANVIHTGDIVFNGFFPFIDTDHGGTLKGMLDAANKIISLSDDSTKIIPGHGAVASKKDIAAYRDMLKEAYTVLSALKKSGKTLEQVTASKPLAHLDETWGKVFFNSEKWISIIYNGIEK